jgi:hypothetical protein
MLCPVTPTVGDCPDCPAAKAATRVVVNRTAVPTAAEILKVKTGSGFFITSMF